MRRLNAIAMVAVVGLTACNGPVDPLAVGVRKVPNDILLGAAESVDAPPAAMPPTAVSIPVLSLPVSPPALAPTLPPIEPTNDPTAAPTPTPTPERCPTADVLSAPALEATPDRAAHPAEARYGFRNEGEFAIGGANAREGLFDSETARAVHGITEIDGGFEYVVTADLAGTITDTTYRVVNVGPAEDILTGLNRDEDLGRGIFIVGVASTDPMGQTSTFTPQPPLTVLPFPAFAGDTFETGGVDPVTGTSMRYTGTVRGHERVDACGSFIDTIAVELTNGQFASPTAAYTFAGVNWLATQYGGLSVADLFERNGTEGIDTSFLRNLATITSVPERATS